MTPCSRYHNITFGTTEVIAISGTEPDTRATSSGYGTCKCCGQSIKSKNKFVIISTPTREDSFFEKTKRSQPQNPIKTQHWKHKNKPKF